MLTTVCMFRYRYGNVESYSIEQIWLAAQTVTGPVKRAKPARKLRPRSAFACPGSRQAMGGKRARGQLRPYGHLMRGGRVVLLGGGQIVLLSLATDTVDQGGDALG